MARTAELLDGKRVAQETLDAARTRVQALVDGHGVTPCLATVLVGADPASITYTKMKRKRCESIGMRSVKVELPATTTQEDLMSALQELGDDRSVHGILLQHPAPPQIDERVAFDAIPPGKDVDGVGSVSFANMWFGEPGFASCTPAGMVRLLDAYGLDVAGKHAVVIGRSAILGKPLTGMLLDRNATVTVCHSRTADVAAEVARADLVCACVGKPAFVKGDWLKEGVVVLDAGYNEGNVGDVDFDAALSIASHITPVPGGVGPMTIAVLIEQTVTAAEATVGLGALAGAGSGGVT
ncbi:MAG: bifunctional 5,10-methylenetetrahydrofolate dehydrogenase/5,10-methenyltetrahydrofolate cyclohydrolase [Planctomycetota bacterium]